MASKLFLTRFIIQGIFVPKNHVLNDGIWLVDNEILLKQIGDEFSAFVVTKGKEDYSETEAENEAKKKISSYLRLCPLLIDKTPTIKPSGSRQISSVSNVGKPPYSVVSSLRIGSRVGLSRIFLESSKRLHEDILRLNQKFLFLETASLFYYNASRYIFDEAELEEFNTRQFIDATISLESVFNDGSGDIKYKLQIRTASVLACIGYAPKDVFEGMKTLYNLRNDIVHGTAKKKGTIQDIKTILDYAKNSLICCYILCLKRKDQDSNKLKESLLLEIDQMLLDETKREAMKKDITEGIEKFRIQNIVTRT